MKLSGYAADDSTHCRLRCGAAGTTSSTASAASTVVNSIALFRDFMKSIDSPTFSNSPRSNTAPLGLQGELMSTILVREVRCGSMTEAVSAKPFFSSVSAKTHLPPA